MLRLLLRSRGLAGPRRSPVTACNEEDCQYNNGHPGEDSCRAHRTAPAAILAPDFMNG